MINNESLLSLGIEMFLNTTPHDSIPLIAVKKIDNITYGRLDIFINKYYNGNMAYLPLLMDFNKISDPIEIKIGTTFELPDFNYIISQLSVNKILEDDIVPGVSQTTDSKRLNKNLSETSKNNITIASPKLKIPLKKVSYDEETGIISY